MDEIRPTEPSPTPLTAQAMAAYMPAAAAERSGVALCLSGGGYRAALFHVGALRRLVEQGILAQIDQITSVSGGSITAAALARAVVASNGEVLSSSERFERDVVGPLRVFTRRNIRTPALLQRLLPWNWLKDDTGVLALAAQYRRFVPTLHVADLPTKPAFVFCSTDLTFGVNWTFTREAIGDFEAGYFTPRPQDDVARAVAASSCFPPVFNPLRPRISGSELHGGSYRKPDRSSLIRGLRLTDGGLYDNLGLEPAWKRRAVVLVSDGGGPFEFSADQGLFWRVTRYSDVLYRQVSALRRRWLVAGLATKQLNGTYWGIAGDVSDYSGDAAGYTGEFAYDHIARIRTDLDAFSDGEAAVLINHGYAMAEAAIAHHIPELVKGKAPFAAPVPALDWHHPDAARAALAGSDHRTLLGRW